MNDDDKMREACLKLRAACGYSERVTRAIAAIETLDNEDGELLAQALVLVEAAQGRPRWRIVKIGGMSGWMTICVEMPKLEHDDPRLGPFTYPVADHHVAKEHEEELRALEVRDRFFVGQIGNWHGRWRLDDVPAWVMESIERDRKGRAR